MHQQLIIFVSIFLRLISGVASLNLCQKNDNVTSYSFKNKQFANCNCPAEKACLRKCCAVGFFSAKGACLQYSDADFTLKVPVYSGQNFVKNATVRDGIVVGVLDCPHFFPFYLNREQPLDDWAYLQADGTILTAAYGLLDNGNFCVDSVRGTEDIAALVCLQTTPEVVLRRVNQIGMIISMPFLLATFIAYALLPNKNLHMKALMFYVISLMFGYLLLVIVQLSDHRFSYESCAVIGYICLFFFILSFFWMNVICIDIWFTFSGLRGFGQGRGGERKRFLLYCIYAWGMSILHILVVFGITQLSSPSDWYNSGIGDGQCFLKRTYPELLYLYGPMAILITINLTLYAITAIKIRNIKKETSVLTKEDSKRHSYEDDKQTFNLYLKLLFAMGVNWIMEVISWAVDWGVGSDKVPSWVWYLTDFCNAIYGVFIFFIFVFKRSIWKLLKRCYYSFIGKPYLAHSMTQNPTRVTSYSTNTSSVHDHHPNNTGRGRHSESAILTSEA